MSDNNVRPTLTKELINKIRIDAGFLYWKINSEGKFQFHGSAVDAVKVIAKRHKVFIYKGLMDKMRRYIEHGD